MSMTKNETPEAVVIPMGDATDETVSTTVAPGQPITIHLNVLGGGVHISSPTTQPAVYPVTSPPALSPGQRIAPATATGR